MIRNLVIASVPDSCLKDYVDFLKFREPDSSMDLFVKSSQDFINGLKISGQIVNYSAPCISLDSIDCEIVNLLKSRKYTNLYILINQNSFDMKSFNEVYRFARSLEVRKVYAVNRSMLVKDITSSYEISDLKGIDGSISKVFLKVLAFPVIYGARLKRFFSRKRTIEL